MKIAVNVSWMAPGKAGGMEWYVRALIDELAQIDDKNDYLLITSHLNDETFAPPSERWSKLRYDGGETDPASYRRLPAPHAGHSPPHLDQMLRGQGVDLLFCPLLYALPDIPDIPTVVTIPDLQHRGLPDLFDSFELGSRNIGFPESVRAATAVLGISDHVASEIRREYGLQDDKVISTPLGLSPEFVSDPELVRQYRDSALAHYRVEGQYVFFPGNAWPHKNHAGLIAAFERVLEDEPDVSLILTGSDAVAALIPPRLRSAVRHLGYVSRTELIGLTSGAAALVFPSLFEGFGLPVLEAMAVSTPILCSDLPTLREVGGEVPSYFDPESITSIASSITSFLAAPEETERQLSTMDSQLKKFSYRSTAIRTLAVFDEVESGARTKPAPDARPNLPLDGNSNLSDGLARWRVHANEINGVEAELVSAAHTSDGRSRLPSRVAIAIEGVVIGELALEPGGSSRTLKAKVPHWLKTDDMVELELHDISHPHAAYSSTVRVARLIVIDDSHGEMRLI